MVDWYGQVNVDIEPKAQIVTCTSFDNLIADEELKLDFTITTTEKMNQLNMYGAYIYGTIPELNGYKPTEVKIFGTNVTYTYNEENGEFTAIKEAIIDDNGVITSNAYTSSNGTTKSNIFNFTVVYPIEAYQEMGEDVSSFEISVPVIAVNKGYNNSNTEDGFENPYISDTATGIVVTTWKKETGEGEIENPSFNIYVGTYMGTPYNNYVVSKEKPMNIYTGKSLEEKDDTFLVQWRANTGKNGITDGVIMKETSGETDSFLNTASTYISMEEITTNKGIYFSGATQTLGNDGWIKIYDVETDSLLQTFTQSNWNSYSSSKPYYYTNTVKHIRVETSSTNELSTLYVYNIKELDDEYITENFTREEFDELSYIYSYLSGYMIETNEEVAQTSYWYEDTLSNKALYEAPTSVATISIKENTISTHTTAENQMITIETVTSGYNEQGWKNGIFLVELPSEIILTEINTVTTNNGNVKISAYDVYEENGKSYIKILTENAEEETYNIIVDCDLTPDPRIIKTTGTIKLYAINEIGYDYYYSSEDVYDVDGDLNVTEQINYATTSLTLEPGSSLTTTQTGSNYGEESAITIAPRVAKTDKNQRTATISITTTNNYTYDIQDIKIVGVVPFEGNDFVLSGNDLGSTFTTYMSEDGIKVITSEIADYTTIYYSTQENPTNDLNDSLNVWTLAEDVNDWNSIKTYMIVLDNSYKLLSNETIEFEYEISLPEGVDYNEVTYSEHAIYFALATEDGLYYTETGSSKLGFMIAKQYDFEIIKYQQDTSKVLSGITFTLTEDGADTSTIKVTDANGIISISGLYAERDYILKEQKTTDDYVLNENEIKFYTYTEINDDGTESLYLVYKNEDGTYSDLKDIYSFIKNASVNEPNSEEKKDYTVQLEIENEVKAKLAISKTDNTTGDVIKNVKFTLTGEGKNGEILTTDKNGYVGVSGLYLDKEYTLEEIKATGYYLPESPIKFTITNDNGTFKLNYSDNETTTKSEITIDNEIPTINLDLKNDKIPTYGLQITKYAKGEESDKVLKGAQYKIYGDGIKETGKTYTTNENGVLTIDGLYEYVEGKYITGEYTISETYAPEGYALNSKVLKFKAYREDRTLKIQILEGEDVIRVITDEETGTTSTDLSIVNSSSSYPVIQIGFEDGQIFTLFKYRTDATINEKVPIPGTKFAITDLKGKPVTGSDGKIVGEWYETSDGKEYYVVTTDENGLITANLPEGLYKAIEVYADDKYIFDENEENRTYYFGIGASKAETFDWINSVSGRGWDYINSVIDTSDGGAIGVGSFSEYSSDIVADSVDGIDLNNDGTIDHVSQGYDDGIIVSYDSEGKYLWSKAFGGSDNDSLNKVIQTSDGGYALVGYVLSSSIKFDNQEITELEKSNYGKNLANKDAVLLKLDSDGNYEWSVRLGGTLDEQINSIVETSEKNLVIVGSYYSSTFNFYETGYYDIKDSFETKGKRDGFVASYSEAGKYQWSQRIGGTSDIEAVDVKEYSSGIAVAANSIGIVYATTNATSATYSGNGSYQIGLMLGYDLDGSYIWNTTIGTTGNNDKITSIDIALDGNIVVGANCGSSSNKFDACIYKISLDGTTATSTLIYTLTGVYDEYVSDIDVTSDGGILFGGWYYSTDGIDVDGDGVTTGKYDLPEISGEYTSDAFVIKLNSDGQVEYASRLYGDGYDGVTGIAETKNGSFVTGGYFNSSTLSATNCKIEQEEENTGLITCAGNSEGFIIMLGASGAEVAEAQTIEVENKMKVVKITTQVKKHIETDTEVAGGTIDGEVDVTYDGITYTEDGIRYIASVNYGEDSTRDINITPDSGYVISYVTINGVEYKDFIMNEDGTATISAFTNLTQDMHVIVEFSNTISSIEVNHYLWTKDDGLTTTKVAESEYYTGNVGDEYTTLPKTDIAYDLITIAEYSGDSTESTDFYIPDNHTGTYIEGEKEVINYYYKEKTYTVTVHHYLEGTNESVPLKGSTTGEQVADEIIEGYAKGEEYTTSQASEDLIDYAIYELAETPANSTGTIEENIEITYYYKIKTTSLNITKVAEENHLVTISGTEFVLYQLISEGSSNEELIDTENVAECWKLVDTYTSSNTGVIKLENLPITSEYRLVETKSSEGRMLPDGQWKIEFIYQDYDENDTSIIEINGAKIRVTAVGNPPALTISEEGNLLLPNKKYFDFPTSGNFGATIFYRVGIVIIFVGIGLLAMRKAIIIKGKNKGKH